MNPSLIAKLGLNSSEFHSKLEGATKETQKFGRGVGDVMKGFGAAGAIAAVTSFFDRIIKHAAASGDALDANVQAVGRFGEAFTAARTSIMDFGVASVGTLNRIGEGFGTALKGAASFFTGTRQQFLDGEKALASTADAAARAAASLAEAQKHAGEFTAITAGLAKLEEKRADLAFKSLTTQERISQLANEQATAEARAADDTLTALDRRRALLEARTAELGLIEQRGKFEEEQAKKAAAWQKEINDEVAAEQKAQAERAKDIAKTTELIATHAEEDRLAKLAALPLLEQQAALSREKRELETQITSIVTDEETRRTAIARLREVDNGLAAAKLTLEQQTTTALAEQARIRKLITDQAAKTNYGESTLAAFGRRTYDNPAEQAAYEAQMRDSALRETDAALAQIEQRINRLAGSGARNSGAQINDLRREAGTLRNRRANIDSYVFDPGYEDAAGLGRIGRRQADYADPGAAGRIEEEAKKQNTTLADIQARLARLIPRT